MKTTTRRNFLLRSAAAFSAPLILPAARVFGAEAPSKQLQIAVIGCGGRAAQVLQQNATYSGIKFVAACDPFSDRAAAFAKALNEKYQTDACKPYQDFREIITRKDIDGVAVFTPDHWHVPVALFAARYGKDMYVEKPLGVAMKWAWKLREEIQKHKVIFQYGTQQRSSGNFRKACELVRNGYIGNIKRVDVWCSHLNPNTHVAIKEQQPVPAGFDYNLWTGPSAMRPYQPERVSNMGSWHSWDCAIGFIAGWGAHPLDICQWGLNTDDSGPVSYEGTGVVSSAQDELYNTTRQWDIHCKYANGTEMHFMDTVSATPVVKAYHYLVRDHGTVFHGENGWIGVDRMAMYSHDQNALRKQEFKSSDARLPVSEDHFGNFLDCMRSRQQTISPFEAALRSDTISHLSEIVVRTKSSLQWDPKSETIVGGAKEQVALLDRPMRDGFSV